MNLKRIINKLTLYESDLYEGKIIIVPYTGELLIKKADNIKIQTDAVCWNQNIENILFKKYNYVLLRKFNRNVNIANELYYDINDLEDKGLNFESFFPIYPNYKVLKYYLDYCDLSINSKKSCLNYAKKLNKNFYK